MAEFFLIFDKKHDATTTSFARKSLCVVLAHICAGPSAGRARSIYACIVSRARAWLGAKKKNSLFVAHRGIIASWLYTMKFFYFACIFVYGQPPERSRTHEHDVAGVSPSRKTILRAIIKNIANSLRIEARGGAP